MKLALPLAALACLSPAVAEARVSIREHTGKVAQPYAGWADRSPMRVPTGLVIVDHDVQASGTPPPPDIQLEGEITSVEGCTQWLDTPTIHLSPALKGRERKRVFFHELGHVWDATFNVTQSLSENVADRYAECSLNAKPRACKLLARRGA